MNQGVIESPVVADTGRPGRRAETQIFAGTKGVRALQVTQPGRYGQGVGEIRETDRYITGASRTAVKEQVIQGAHLQILKV